MDYVYLCRSYIYYSLWLNDGNRHYEVYVSYNVNEKEYKAKLNRCFPVYINPKNRKQYIMDIDILKENMMDLNDNFKVWK